jgi:hypothetical protein
MDPEKTLSTAREAAWELLHALDQGTPFDPEAAETLATAFDSLDQWLSRGGFLPRPWRKPR